MAANVAIWPKDLPDSGVQGLLVKPRMCYIG
jgi:hypothetical protein